MATTTKQMKAKQSLYAKRKARTNAKVKEQQFDVRIIVQKSNKHITAQAIDHNGNVVGSISDLSSKSKTKTDRAMDAGKEFAQQLALGNKKVVFDRNGYLYHGRVKAFADGLREGGIQI